ncbi:lanthionine synthetase C family protein [Caldibacillus thermoamylovorans]|uniref:lanthionine synthetase C family protein n=1 Tax=Caldibacillus thermoamylovorans TaxID=35841 RepID=UPI0020411E51|nr:lanthionine synthetase C family protein [Caldibacillus thermoamylovorans]MCM3476816.1 lanthionine synthetase C family protein [Caldibacillus thermoamylovorans]
MSVSVKEPVCNIARKLSDYENMLQIVNHPKNFLQIGNKRINPFHELSLSHGLPALCALYGEMSEHYPDEDWDALGHQYMKRIGEQINQNGFSSLSMFTGLTGVALAAVCLSKEGKRYQKFIANINIVIEEKMEEIITNLKQKSYPNMDDYDAISGVAGIAGYCLLFPEEMKKTITLILKYIIDLSQDKEMEDLRIPGWYILPEHAFSEREKRNWPSGFINIGLSHGIPALLIILCNAKKLNIYTGGLDECIQKIADFLIKFQIKDEIGVYWGTHVSLEEYYQGTVLNKNTRDAWCYGTPGVAYSLLIAGKTLNNQTYIDCAIRGMELASKRLYDIFSPSFCHGLAGVAYICNRFYEETNISDFRQTALTLANDIMKYYNKEYPFGFKNIEGSEKGKEYYDYVGLIDGTAGILLTLLAIQNGKKTPWDSAFLLSKV